MLRELAVKRAYALALVMTVLGTTPDVQAGGAGAARKFDDIPGIILSGSAELEARIQQRMQGRLQRQLERYLVLRVKIEDRGDLADMTCDIDFERPIAVLGE